jgi:hypothetical protein
MILFINQSLYKIDSYFHLQTMRHKLITTVIKMTYFRLLSQDLLIKIYEYDNTYREIFKNEISIEIWKESFKFWLRYQNRIDSRQNYLLQIVMPTLFDRWYFETEIKIRKKPKIENSFYIKSSKKDKFYYQLSKGKSYPSDIKFEIYDREIFVGLQDLNDHFEGGIFCFVGEIFSDKKKAINHQNEYCGSFPTGKVLSDGMLFVIERRDW